MSSKGRMSAVAAALQAGGANVRATPPAADTPAPATAAPAKATAQPSRVGRVTLSLYYPAEVRRQLKTLAAEQGRSMEDVVAEGLNLLFVAHGKPEIAPRK